MQSLWWFCARSGLSGSIEVFPPIGWPVKNCPSVPDPNRKRQAPEGHNRAIVVAGMSEFHNYSANYGLQMKSLLVVAHGSRRAESNQEIKSLTEKVSQRCADKFDRVECAYLELAEPLIPDAIRSLADNGAKSVLVVPYFLARGAHVASDIPEQINIAQQANPDLEIVVSDYLGAASEMPDLIVQLADNA